MIKEKTFLRVFKKNCKEMLKTAGARERAIDNLYHQECPFPDGCKNDPGAEPRCHGCLGSSPTIPSNDCPISKEWQSNVFYFQKNKDGIEGGELCEKMIKVIREEVVV